MTSNMWNMKNVDRLPVRSEEDGRVVARAIIAVCAAAGTLLVAASMAAGILLLAPADSAAAARIQFGSLGEGAGQFVEPKGVAVEQQSGSVYIVDENNQRVEKFTKEGGFLLAWGFAVANGEDKLEKCTTACRTGDAGEGSGQFDYPGGVAVNNDPLSPSHGDVYVVDSRNHRVEKFGPEGEFILAFGGEVNKTTGGEVCTAASGDTCGAGVEGTAPGEFERANGRVIAVDAEGHVYVGDSAGVQRFSEDGAFEASGELGAGDVTELAAAPAGKLYERSGLPETGVREYEVSLSGTELKGTKLGSARDADSGAEPRAIASGSNGELFVDVEAGGVHHILEYDAAGAQVESFDTGEEDGSGGIALGETIDRLYLVVSHSEPEVAYVRIVAMPPPGPLVPARSQSATAALPATVRATVNPEGATTSYRFDYGTEVSKESATATRTLSAGFADEPVAAILDGLTPETTYHFHVFAENADGHAEGPDQSFTTPPAIAIAEEAAAAVTDSTATIETQINPSGAAVTYWFEYWTGAYRASTAQRTSAVTLPAGSEYVRVSVPVSGLTPATTYQWRLIGKDERGGVIYTVEGSAASFTTQRSGEPLTLPDHRAWELVSPPVSGALLTGLHLAKVDQASADGRAITYVAENNATEAQAQGQPGSVQVLSTRGAQGWSSEDIATPHRESAGFSQQGAEYRFFSEDLSRAVVEPVGPFSPLEACAATGCSSESFPAATERTPYLRHDLTCVSERASCYEPLLTAAEGYADVSTGAAFGGTDYRLEAVRFLDGTPDARHILVSSPFQLTATPFQERPGAFAIYEWSASAPARQRLAPVSVLPASEGGTLVSATLGSYETAANYRHAISSDGSRVFFGTTTAKGEHPLYMRDLAKGETVRLDVPQGGVSAGEAHAVFQDASANGSRVFFTDSEQLTPQAGKGRNLYVCEIVEEAGKDACRLSDLTPSAGQVQSLHLPGVGNLIAGVSEHGSYVYFVSSWVLSSEPSVSGERASAEAANLYVRHYDEAAHEWEAAKLIAVLSPEDSGDWAGEGEPIGFEEPKTRLENLTARVSPDGGRLAFMSDRPLTGYDTHDALSGRPDEEVYLYDAAGNALVCASCNPTGARPLGAEATESTGEANLADHHLARGTWWAASVPGWTQYGGSEAVQQSRYLSNSGRLFFDATDALLPQDVSGAAQVYEYEPAGVGSCGTTSSTYSERAAGCVGMISSGTSAEESAFVEASEEGSDVFFLTAAKLVPADTGSTYAIYDAHICSATAPCPSATPQPSAPCATGGQCKAANIPASAALGPPASVTFSGRGNITVSKAANSGKSTNKNQKKKRRRRLRRALKRCHAKHRHNRRKQRTCKRRVWRRLGAHSSIRWHGHRRHTHAHTSRTQGTNASRRGRR